jgi:hypothetical protein
MYEIGRTVAGQVIVADLAFWLLLSCSVMQLR